MGVKANTLKLDKILYYFYEQNSKLYWKTRVANCRSVGDRAGGYNGKGYLVVMLNDKGYQVHRILYQIYNNVVLDEYIQIDHINGIKDDNRKENLRIVTNSQNQCNKKVQKNNKSTGTKNISKRKNKVGNEYYVLSITKNETHYLKLFRTDKFTIEEIIKIRDEKLKEIHGDFACFD